MLVTALLYTQSRSFCVQFLDYLVITVVQVTFHNLVPGPFHIVTQDTFDPDIRKYGCGFFPGRIVKQVQPDVGVDRNGIFRSPVQNFLFLLLAGRSP